MQRSTDWKRKWGRFIAEGGKGAIIWKSPAQVKIRLWSCRAYLDDGDGSLLAAGPAFVYIATGFPLHGPCLKRRKVRRPHTNMHGSVEFWNGGGCCIVEDSRSSTRVPSQLLDRPCCHSYTPNIRIDPLGQHKRTRASSVILPLPNIKNGIFNRNPERLTFSVSLGDSRPISSG